MDEYIIDFEYNGETYSFTLIAFSYEDAVEKLKAIAETSRVIGILEHDPVIDYYNRKIIN